jgi:hypothetical protein
MPDNRFWRDASWRLTFEMSRAPGGSYRPICDAVVATFHLTTHSELVTNGVDVVFQDYRLGDQVVGLEWDNWCGFMVVAKTPAAEPLVQEIAAWLLQSQWSANRRSS